jgi:hydroxysqualene dehydroxylase
VTPTPQATVAVIGAGWAGLAAAIEATLLGHAVTLWEMAPTAGGRARSVGGPLGPDDMPFDNGQHILIGAYRDTLRLMREVGADAESALLRAPLALVDGDGCGLRLPAGAPMLAFARGVCAHRGWTAGERCALLWAATRWAAARFRCSSAWTVETLCRGLPHAVLHDLIEPLCVAALNTPAAEASAQVFLNVLRDALFSGPGSADLLLPRRPLGELLPEPAVRWLVARGVTVLTSRRVNRLDRDHRGWQVDGQRFDGVVLACTAGEAARLSQPHAPAWAQCAAALRYEPIVTVVARSAGTRLPQPMTLLRSGGAHGPAQFVFDHGWLNGRDGVLSLVISAAQPWVDAGSAATAEATVAQARTQLGSHLKSPLHTVQVFNEKRATFRCTPDLSRPATRVADRLVAAGDYIDGRYPATLEGAVQSGVHAARHWYGG